MRITNGIVISVFTAAFSLLPVPALSQDKPGCDVFPYEGSMFSDLYDQATAVSNELCAAFQQRLETGSADNLRIEQVLGTYLQQAQGALDEYRLDQAADYSEEFARARDRLSIIDLVDLDLPNFIVNSPLGDGTASGEFESGYNGYATFDINEPGLCTQFGAVTSCEEAFQEFSYAFNPYRSAYENLFDPNAESLDNLSTRWDKFLEASKSQTALEAFLTTQLHRKHFQSDFLVGPPPSQVIALHPDLVYEKVDNGPDGSQADIGLSVEWIGINWWDQKVPLGISLASVYVDHNGVRDVGHGIQLHFYNRYSIGWARHDHDDAIYLNIDVLQFLETRRAKFQKYMKAYF